MYISILYKIIMVNSVIIVLLLVFNDFVHSYHVALFNIPPLFYFSVAHYQKMIKHALLYKIAFPTF